MNGERKGETEKEREEGRSKESKKPGLDEKEKGKETEEEGASCRLS